MTELQELIQQYKDKYQNYFKEYTDGKYTIQGRWFLGQCSTTIRDQRLQLLWQQFQRKCEDALKELATGSGDPLIQWIADNVDNKDTAFNLIKRMPLDCESLDKLVERSRMDCTTYQNYRLRAIQDGVLKEYKNASE